MGTMFSGCDCVGWMGGVGYSVWWYEAISGCEWYSLMSLKLDMSQEIPRPAMDAGMLCGVVRA